MKRVMKVLTAVFVVLLLLAIPFELIIGRPLLWGFVAGCIGTLGVFHMYRNKK